MKLLFAECCGTLVVPDNEAGHPVWCRCKHSAVWWNDPIKGRLAVWANDPQKVSVVGLHNGLLQADLGKDGVISKAQVRQLLKETPATYLFKKVESLVIRMSPTGSGKSDDVMFEATEPARPPETRGPDREFLAYFVRPGAPAPCLVEMEEDMPDTVHAAHNALQKYLRPGCTWWVFGGGKIMMQGAVERERA